MNYPYRTSAALPIEPSPPPLAKFKVLPWWLVMEIMWELFFWLTYIALSPLVLLLLPFSGIGKRDWLSSYFCKAYNFGFILIGKYH